MTEVAICVSCDFCVPFPRLRLQQYEGEWADSITALVEHNKSTGHVFEKTVAR